MKTTAKATYEVLVICGGANHEARESIAVARDVCSALGDHGVWPVVVDPDGKWHLLDAHAFATSFPEHPEDLWRSAVAVELSEGGEIRRASTGAHLGRIDIVFPTFYDPLRYRLASSGVPYVGEPPAALGLMDDKEVTKILLSHAGLPVVPWVAVEPAEEVSYEALRRRLGPELVIKPSHSGASLGVGLVRSKAELGAALEDAFYYSPRALVERRAQGREIECCVLGSSARRASLDLCEIGPHSHELFSYEMKMSDEEGQLVIPAALDATTVKTLRHAAESAAVVCRSEFLCRVDFFVESEGRFWINEINSSPWLGRNNTVPALLQHEGVPYRELIESLLEMAIH